MMKSMHSIPCPVCQTSIPVNINLLLGGQRFVCPECSAAIGLSEESRPLVKNVYSEYQSMLDNAAKKQKTTMQ